MIKNKQLSPMAYMLLLFIDRKPGTTQKELSFYTGVEISTISRNINSLEKLNLISYQLSSKPKKYIIKND